MKPTRPESTDWDLYMDGTPSADGRDEPEAVEIFTAPLPVAGKHGKKAATQNAFLKLTLEHLLLSPRTRQTLEKQGLKTLGDLCRQTLAQLKGIPGLGTKAMAEIQEALDYYDVALAAQPPPLPQPQHKAPTSKRNKTSVPLITASSPCPVQLCLPDTDAALSPRLCPNCQAALLSAETFAGFCSKACRSAWNQRQRPSRQKEAQTSPLQRVLDL